MFSLQLWPRPFLLAICFASEIFALSAAWPVLHIALLCPLRQISFTQFFCKASSSIFRVWLQPWQLVLSVCVLMFTVYFCSWLKNCSMNAEMKKLLVVRIVSRPFGVPKDGPHAKCSLCRHSCILWWRPQAVKCLPIWPAHSLESAVSSIPCGVQQLLTVTEKVGKYCSSTADRTVSS